MVKPVSLSDPAFEALRSEKRESESDSDVVLRLVREARSARKDPEHFLDTRASRERALAIPEHEDALAEMRDADRDRLGERLEERRDDP